MIHEGPGVVVEHEPRYVNQVCYPVPVFYPTADGAYDHG